MKLTPYETMRKVVERFQHALKELKYEASAVQVEKWTTNILDAMTGRGRIYHSPSHILTLSENMDGLGILAAFYHDIVYYQIDGGLPACLHATVSPYINVVNGVIYLNDVLEEDREFNMVLEIFGFERKQKLLSHSGQNEFLSALVAAKELATLLQFKELVMIAVCIEATIPFRGTQGKMEELQQRFSEVNKKYQLGLSESLIHKGMQRAVQLANKDVENFSFQDAKLFLENTWELLPEGNARLAETPMYTVKEYRIALHKMESFLSKLDPRAVFYRYDGQPTQAKDDENIGRVQANLRVGTSYLRIKLYAIAVLEAIADLSGGDVPLVYFIGNEKRSKPREQSYTPFMALLENATDAGKLDPFMTRLLTDEKIEQTSFENQSAHLSAFLYRSMGETVILQKIDECKDFFVNKISSKDFLKKQNKKIVEQVIGACAQMAVARSSVLLQLQKSFAA